MNRLLSDTTIERLRRKKRRSKDVTTSVKLPRALDIALKREARRQQRSQSWLIREAIQSCLTFRQHDKKIGQEQFDADKRRALSQ